MQMAADIEKINEMIRGESAFTEKIISEIGKIIVGQKQIVERILIGLLSDGHILLEGVPGLAKTLANEYAGDGILVNNVCTGFIDTELLREEFEAEADA